ncbi:MAG: cytochrome c1 [Sphingomonadaceae bacterium]
MVRIIAILIGSGLALVLLVSFVTGATIYFTEERETSLEYKYHEEPKEIALASDGPFGQFDERQLQRGFQVYKEVCAACHGLEHVAFRHLGDLGFVEAEVKAIAEQWPIQATDIDPETGETIQRPPLPTDHFPDPYANEVAARAANNNTVPPDLSLIVKARENGSDYLYSLLTGYTQPPAELVAEKNPAPTLHYNPYYHSLFIAMPPPLLAEGQVSYADGTRATISQMARDVTAFLTWAAEPNLEARRATGIAVVIYLTVATLLAYLAYRNIWGKRKKRRRDATDPEPPSAAERA